MSNIINNNNNNNTLNQVEFAGSPIASFYADKTILVTGSTGFIGKVLVEKLLYSCPNLNKIYLLIRSSKGKNARDRMLEMISEKPFDIRLKKDHIASKLVAIESDLIQDNLGLSDADAKLLIDQVDIIFHVAASVKFEAPFEENIKHNVIATKTLLDIASKFNQLKCFVHVSTAYSNCQLKQIDERVYSMNVGQDFENMKLTKEMLDNRPNTYTYTKAIAETVISKYASRMNVVIVRPSIVMSSLKEPAEGWVDTINGPVGLSIMGALGILQKIKVNSEVVFDLIPADLVANALVSIGWANTELRDEFSPGSSPEMADLDQNDSQLSIVENGSHSGGVKEQVRKTFVKLESTGNEANDRKKKKQHDGTVRVFNLTSGDENPCSFYDYFRYGRDRAHKYPSARVVRPLLTIPKQRGMNSIIYWIHKIFSHLLFGYIVDFILNLFGQKRMCIKAVHRMHYANEVFDFFCSNQWTFGTDNVKRLRELQSYEDRRIFNCDVRQLDWSEYGRISWFGMRRFILKEDDDTIPLARLRYRKICYLFYLTKLFLIIGLTLMIRQPLIVIPLYAIIYII